ncbi:MAG: PulJ/GspJ family protein [Gemmatimonadota bacterium]
MKTARAGMTLMEVVVALSLASVVSTIGYAAFSAVVDESETMVARGGNVRAAMVRRTITDWLHSAILLPGVEASSFRALDGVHEDDALDELQFVTAAPTALKARVSLVRLYIDTDSTTSERGLVAELREWSGRRQLRVQLDTLVSGLDGRYASRLLGDRDWLPSWVSSSVLPDKAELRLSGPAIDPLLSLPIVTVVGARK